MDCNFLNLFPGDRFYGSKDPTNSVKATTDNVRIKVTLIDPEIDCVVIKAPCAVRQLNAAKVSLLLKCNIYVRMKKIGIQRCVLCLTVRLHG